VLKKKPKDEDHRNSRVSRSKQAKHEVIKFGETNQALPSLIAPRKALKNEIVARPGQREILLTSMLAKT
jgi:hypothetical protein